jgi:hypothetical protein
MDWLMRPILSGVCSYDALFDERYNLVDFAIMNDALNIQNENERRLDAAEKLKVKGK